LEHTAPKLVGGRTTSPTTIAALETTGGTTRRAAGVCLPSPFCGRAWQPLARSLAPDKGWFARQKRRRSSGSAGIHQLRL